jgi:hypothetical protein
MGESERVAECDSERASERTHENVSQQWASEREQGRGGMQKSGLSETAGNPDLISA